jgi:diaminopimelate epimerase
MHFVKMHGIGNDYLFVDGRHDPIADPSAVSRLVSDRHRGVGSDGLIIIDSPGDPANHARMRMFNADGSDGEMCGNGIRCVAKYLVDRGIADAQPLRVETAGGVRSLAWHRDAVGKVGTVTVDMGAPSLAAGSIPADIPGIETNGRVIAHSFDPVDFGIDRNDVRAFGMESSLTLVSMGNPHVVIFCSDVDAAPLDRLGPIFESHAWFPNRINLHFVEVTGPGSVRMRTWERGSGMTQACGTGACAVCVAGVLEGRVTSPLEAMLPGGRLRLDWTGNSGDSVSMSGPAAEVFECDIDLTALAVEEAGDDRQELTI